MRGDLHPLPLVVEGIVRVVQLEKGAKNPIVKDQKTQMEKVQKERVSANIVLCNQTFSCQYYVFNFGEKNSRRNLQTCSCGVSEQNVSAINLVWTLFCDTLKNMKRFIIFYIALFIFVGVLLNFAWLYHLLLPSEVIFFSLFPRAVRRYSMSPLSGSRTKNILVQMDGTHY